MVRTPQYQKLLKELESGELNEIERKILDVLLNAPNGSTCQGLIRIVFGVEPQRNLGNDAHDRKIRKGIESLRNRLIAIVSSSGKAGYLPFQNMTNIIRIHEECNFRDKLITI